MPAHSKFFNALNDNQSLHENPNSNVDDDYVDFYFLASDEAYRRRQAKNDPLFSNDRDSIDYDSKVTPLKYLFRITMEITTNL